MCDKRQFHFIHFNICKNQTQKSTLKQSALRTSSKSDCLLCDLSPRNRASCSLRRSSSCPGVTTNAAVTSVPHHPTPEIQEHYAKFHHLLGRSRSLWVKGRHWSYGISRGILGRFRHEARASHRTVWRVRPRRASQSTRWNSEPNIEELNFT